jgi:hypothetical protein
MHFRFAFQLGYAFEKSFAVETDGAAERIIVIEDSSETERKDRGSLKTFADYMGMLEKSRLPKFSYWQILTHDDSEFPAGISKCLRIADTAQTFNWKWTSCASAALECLLLGDAVCVPCH